MSLPIDYDAPALTMAQRLASASKASQRRAVRQQAQFDRDTAECAAIIAARPLGSETPREEPKSIYSPSPPARVRWQAPIPKGTGPRKRWAEG